MENKKEKTILIVEDEKSLSNAISDVLNRHNFISIQAKDGKEGLELALKEHPDLILLDLIMPEMDGMTTLRKIREDSWGQNVPVIILTNLSATDEQLISDMIKYKALNYLIKSDWKLEDVIKKVEEILEKQNS